MREFLNLLMPPLMFLTQNVRHEMPICVWELGIVNHIILPLDSLHKSFNELLVFYTFSTPPLTSTAKAPVVWIASCQGLNHLPKLMEYQVSGTVKLMTCAPFELRMPCIEALAPAAWYFWISATTSRSPESLYTSDVYNGEQYLGRSFIAM